MKMNEAQLSFRISSGLKNLIGKDLIGDKFIAIFELVKNAYDADASKVVITFKKDINGKNCICITDDGCGMSYDDIINKWLFVAYSEKKAENKSKSSYRDAIRREYAGAKGVGRFSCDRLGSSLVLLSKTKDERHTNRIYVDWNKFEIDDSQDFSNIHVDYSLMDSLPNNQQHGTILIISDLREIWDRNELLKLKASLKKLISPDMDFEKNPFSIELIALSEKDNDVLKIAENAFDREIVNGIIYNDIFEKLNIKTTSVKVNISTDGMVISTKLYDRGEYVFSLKEKNRYYGDLHDIAISLYYLNQQAKANFTHQMGGVQPKNYGSVFIYKNGFRINPYGNPGQDFFGIDQRKAQGWKRYLGTRELMGRISINGDNDGFIETTSRAHGFIQTPAVEQLSDFFIERVLKVLEKYVVNLINWGEPLKNDSNHTISLKEIGSQIISQFFYSIDERDIIDFDFNKNLLSSSVNIEDSDSISNAIKKLGHIAESTQNKKLSDLAASLKKRTELIMQENDQLESINVLQSVELKKVKQENEVRERQIYFLKSNINKSVTNLIEGYHSVYASADAAIGNIEGLIKKLDNKKQLDGQLIFSTIVSIQRSVEKIKKLSDLAIHGNQSLKQNGIHSLYDYVSQYLASGIMKDKLAYEIVAADNVAYNCKFNPVSISIIIDNIFDNSVKASSSKLVIAFSETESNVIVSFTDNGVGLPSGVDTDLIFELGYSSNRQKIGAGIGLFHVRQLIKEMKGTVDIDSSYTKGFRIIIRMKK